MPTNNLDKSFSPKRFNESSVSDMMTTAETKIIIINKSSDEEENKILYDNFNSQFKSYLTKISYPYIKKYVSEVYNRDLVFIGSIMEKNDLIFSRLLIDSSDKLNGIVLNSLFLEINIQSGDTPSIDDCIYSVYGGLVRASILVNKNNVIKNINLHKLICSYLYLIFLKSAGQKIIYNEKQKQFINMICTYTYFTHFLNYKQGPVLSIMKTEFKDFFNKDWFAEFLSLIKNVKYTRIKDIPSIMIDLNISTDPPARIYLELLKLLGTQGFYSLISSLDQLIQLIIIGKYNTELYKRVWNKKS